MTYFEGDHRLVRWRPATGETVTITQAGELGALLNTSSLAQSRSGRVALVHFSPAYRIWRHDPDGSSTLIAEQPIYQYVNSLSVNDAGEVAYRTSWALHRSDGVSTVDIARAFVDVQGFGWRTALSDAGVVAFMATGLDGISGLYIGNGTSLRRLVAVGDTILTDLGPTVITDLAPDTGNFGNRAFDMTRAGDIALIVHTSGSSVNEALILLRVRTPCRADWNGDHSVNSADISAYLAAWLASLDAGDLAADFNTDGAVNSADISAFLAAWLDALNNGC